MAKSVGLNKLILGIFGLIFLNLIILDFVMIKNLSFKGKDPVLETSQPLESRALDISALACPDSCISRIQEASESAHFSQSPTPTPQAKVSTVAKTFKDYYINLGSGSNRSVDWEDVGGTLTTIDLGSYQNIKEVRLESTINVPTANGMVSVRLFNKTGNYAVGNSDRTVQAQANGDIVISEPLFYEIGPKLYQIQMKSQLNVPTNLTQARLHIVAQ